MIENEEISYLKKEFSLKTKQIFPTTYLPSDLLMEKCFKIDENTPIVSMGSCYARFIKSGLLERKYNYVQTEYTKGSKHSSAGWGRIYTIANFWEILNYIINDDKKNIRFLEFENEYIDLIRYRTKFSSLSAAHDELNSHIVKAKEALTNAKVLIYAAAQNEVWFNHKQNFFFGERPPLKAYEKEDVSVRYLSLEENERYLQESYNLLKNINPNCKFVVCITPMPAMVTFLNKNVVTQSVFYKSLLRVAVESFLNKNPEVIYFPTYDLSLVNEYYPHDESHRYPNKQFIEKTMNMFDSMFK